MMLTVLLAGLTIYQTSVNDTTFEITEPSTYIRFSESCGNPFEFGLKLMANETTLANIEKLSYPGGPKDDWLCMIISLDEINILEFANFKISGDYGENRSLSTTNTGNVIWEKVSYCRERNYNIFSKYRIFFYFACIFFILFVCIIYFCIRNFLLRKKIKNSEKRRKKRNSETNDKFLTL